jgi:hypothetical protein
MKKILILALIALIGCSTAAFAAGGFAIGGEGALYIAGNGGLPAGAMLSLKLPQFPLMLGIGVSWPLSVGLTADYWIAHGNIVSILDWYVGVGGYASVSVSPVDINVGGRIPIGLQVWPIGKTLELFIEAAPAVGVYFIPTGFDWHIQGAAGLRFWF